MSPLFPERASLQRTIVEPLTPALAFGAWSGVTGVVAGGFGGILLSQHPALFAIVAGLQWFGLGSTFWYVRNLGTQPSANAKMPNGESLLRSTLAGSMTGAMNGAFKSRSKVLPGALVFGTFSMLGQGAYNSLGIGERQLEHNKPWTQRLLESRWLLLKPLSDEHYLAMLDEKAIKVNAEIDIVDEKIAALQKSGRKSA